jgi:pimeloyl-ACP methyl ester carboxylesterase
MRNVKLSRKARFRYVRGIRKPALVLYGENDEFCYDDVPRCVAILDEAIGAKANIELAIMQGAGHGFAGFEEELATLIADWT